MMGYGSGMGWGMWLLLIVSLIGFWTLIVVVIRTVSGGRNAPAGPQNPLTLLDERLARGEIDIDEYTARRRVITAGH